MMKRIARSILTVCLLMSLLFVFQAGVSAADDTKLRVSGLTNDETLTLIKEYTVFEDGWNEAIALAEDSQAMKESGYSRVVIDLLADWSAVDGEFTGDYFNGPGFNWDAIYFPENVKVTLNLNGHTIDRGLEEWEYNGEVMYVDKHADLIINGGKDETDTTTGTITGGFSCNGAGGIHVNDGATVTLNYVNVTGNSVDDDDGAGIAIYDDAKLTVNYGSISNNYAIGTTSNNVSSNWGCGLYVDDSTAKLNHVTFADNRNHGRLHGAAIYAQDSNVELDGCTITGNGVDKHCYTVLDFQDCDVVIKNTTVDGNGSPDTDLGGGIHESYLVEIERCDKLEISNSVFRGNLSREVINVFTTSFTITDTVFQDNKGSVLHSSTNMGEKDDEGFLINCTITGNRSYTYNDWDMSAYNCQITLDNCVTDDLVLNSPENFHIIASVFAVNPFAASVIGSNTSGLVLVLLSLVILVTTISILLVHRRKKQKKTDQ